jgi:hypothetical protein
VLPNVTCLSDRAAEVVRRFVRQGGGLVASLESSLVDANFQRRPDFALGDLFRAKYVRTHQVNMRSENVYLHIEGKHPVTDDPAIAGQQGNAWTGGDGPPPPQGALALIGSSAEVIPVAGGQVLATFRRNVAGGEIERLPAVIASEFGKGRVVFFPAGVDKAMFFFPNTYMRQLLANAVRWTARDVPPPLEVRGPLLLAATFRTQPETKRVVVHLLNDHSSYGRHSIYQKLAPLPRELEKKLGFPDQSELRGTWPVREEVIPLHDLVVRCRLPGVVRATQQPENLPLPLRKTAGGVEVTVPKLLMHSMVVFELKDPS